MAKPDKTGLKTLNTAYLNGSTFKEPNEVLERYNLASIQQHYQTQFVQSFERFKSSETNALDVFKNPVIGGFQMLDCIADYFAGEFIPSCESDESFLGEIRLVGRFLINKGYFGGVYIAYSEEVRELERKAIESQGKEGFKPNHFPRSKFRFFTRVNDEGNEFKSLLNNNVHIALDPSKLVYVSYKDSGNFLAWGTIVMEYAEGLNMVVNCSKTAMKTMVIDKGSEAKWAQIEEQFLNPTTYILRSPIAEGKAYDEPLFTPLVFYPVQDVIATLKNVKALFDERAGFLGWFGKDLDQKKERVTVQEGAMSTKLINNQLESMLVSLRSMVGELKEVYGETIPKDFDIEIERIKPQLNNQPMMEKDDANIALED